MSEAVLNPNKVSRAGVILIKSFEGFRPAAVRRADGVWVIGYGHTASAREGQMGARAITVLDSARDIDLVLGTPLR